MKLKKGRIDYNLRESYAIKVVKIGEVVKKFRTKATALGMLSHYENIIMEDLEVVEL